MLNFYIVSVGIVLCCGGNCAVRGGDEKEIYEIKEDIRLLSERMGKLRKSIRICDKIEEQKPVINERIADCRKAFEQKISAKNRYARAI